MKKNTQPLAQETERELEALLGKPGRKRPAKKLLLLLGGALVLAGGALALILLLPKAGEADTQAVYREYTVEYGDITVGQSESSSISLNRETVTFPVSATVEEVYVKAGSSVKAGDPLVRLNTEDIAEGLASYELQLEIAGLQLEQAKLQLETRLLSAKQQLETSRQTGSLAATQEELAVAQLQSALTKAQNELTQAQADLDEYTLLSATFEKDYRRLSYLKDQVEDCQDEVSALQAELSGTTDYASEYESAQAKAKAAWTQLQMAANALQALGADASAQLTQISETYDIGGAYAIPSATDTSAFINEIKSELENAVSQLTDEAAKAAAQDTASTLISQLNSLDGYAKQVADYAEKVQTSSGERTGIQSELAAAQDNLSYYQELLSDFESEYNETYGNVADAEALAERVLSLETEVEDAALALQKAQLALTTGTTQAEQERETAKTQASTAQTTYELTEMELSQAVDSAQEEYNALEDQIEEVKALISEDGVVYADCNGMVASVNVEAGDGVSVFVDEDSNQIMAYAQLLTMTNISDVYVPITISEEDILGVSIGQAASVSMTAFPNRTFAAEVDTITVESSRSGAATVSYTVNVRFSEENELDMYEGMSAEVTLIQRAAQGVLYINVQAVTNTNGVATVLKKAEDGSGVVTEVKTGFSDGRYVEILEGLSEDDVVLAQSAVGRS